MVNTSGYLLLFIATGMVCHKGPLLLTWFNFNPNIDK